jgi:hypothetical protein
MQRERWRQAGALTKQPISDSPNEIVIGLYGAVIPGLVALIEEARRLIKQFQLTERVLKDTCGNMAFVDDVAPQQAVRATLLRKHDSRLREALRLLQEAMEYGAPNRGPTKGSTSAVVIRPDWKIIQAGPEKG